MVVGVMRKGLYSANTQTMTETFKVPHTLILLLSMLFNVLRLVMIRSLKLTMALYLAGVVAIAHAQLADHYA